MMTPDRFLPIRKTRLAGTHPQNLADREAGNSTPALKAIDCPRLMERDVGKVQEIYMAYQRRNFKHALMFMAADVRLSQSRELPWGGDYNGHAGVLEFLEKLNQQVESKVRVENLIDAGEHVVAIGRTSGTVRATKLEFEVPFVHVWRFREGQVASLEAYVENATFLGALGCL